MPLSLSNLRNNTRNLKIRFENVEGDLNLVIYPHRYTPELQKRWEDSATDTNYDEMAGVLGEIIDEWDLLDDNGETLPIDGDTVILLGLSVILAMFEKIGEAINPQAKSRRRNGRS